jgi:zinc protease
MINAICNPNNLAKAIVCLDEEIAKILSEGVTEAELAEAKKGYLQQQQVRRASEQALPGLLSSELYLGRTMQHEVDLEKAIEALTPEIVNKALRKHVDPKKIVVIGAGDVKTEGSKP